MAIQHKTRPTTPPAPQAPRQQSRISADIARQPHSQVTTDEMIRMRAYALWEQAGKPPSDGTPFWLQAERELSPSK